MSAQPVPDPDLETTVRHVLPQKIDSVAYGLSLMHHDVREIRRAQDDHGLQLGDLAEGQRAQGEALGLHGGRLEALAEGQRAQGEALGLHGGRLEALAEGQRAQGEALGLHGGRLEALAEGQRAQGEQLADLQRAAAEILRRLPDPGATGT
jgi:hypothetical protein